MKSLRPGPRSLVAYGALFGLLLLLAILLGIYTGQWFNTLRLAGIMLLLAACVIVPIVFTRVDVRPERIVLHGLVGVTASVAYEDIGFSAVGVLAGGRQPVTLTLVGRDNRSELMTIRLNLFLPEEVEWLLAQPELRVRR